MATSLASELVDSRSFESKALAAFANQLAARGIRASVTYCERTTNSALNLDLEGDLEIGRLTLWSDGSYLAETLRIEDEASTHSQRGSVATQAELRSVIEALVESFAPAAPLA